MDIVPTGGALGARIEEHRPRAAGLRRRLQADPARAGRHGVLCFPQPALETDAFARFGRMFGDLEINVANQFHEPDFPEVMVLSNMTQGRQAGRARRCRPGLAHGHVLQQGHRARQRAATPSRCRCATAGRWATRSSATCIAAYEDLPADMKRRLAGPHRDARLRQVLGHDARAARLAARAAHAGAARQEAAGIAADLSHATRSPAALILYCNPGYAMRIDGMARGRERRAAGVPVPPPGTGRSTSMPTNGPKATC